MLLLTSVTFGTDFWVFACEKIEAERRKTVWCYEGRSCRLCCTQQVTIFSDSVVLTMWFLSEVTHEHAYRI
jgi:hypothetical protein